MDHSASVVTTPISIITAGLLYYSLDSVNEKVLRIQVRLFADDTSLSSVIENEIIGAEELNRDLEKVRLWVWQWKMQFNTDKTEEVIFSTKLARSFHPPLLLGNDEVKREDEHKHLGMILDSKLNFKSHIRAAILKARRGIGLIRYLSKYVSRDVLNPMVVGLFDSTILVGGAKKPPLPNSLLVIDRATKFGMLKASGMYFL